MKLRTIQKLIFFLFLINMALTYELYSGYEIKERIDYTAGLVFLEAYKDNVYLGIEKVLTLAEYFDYQATKSIKQGFKEIQKKAKKKQELEFGTEGLIPEIEIPRLPIFGEGSKINIQGSDKITFGGRQTTVYGAGITQTGISQSALPELKMEQELRINLDGTIGDKTKILIDHDSQREFLGKNKIKLSYTGTEDEIVQSVEMGDTRLVIPATGYTGDLPAHKGLFGITTKGKLGGLDLYAVASTEQSQAQTAEFRGRTQMTTDTIYDYEFEKRRFYLVDTLATQEVTNLLVFVDQRIANPQNYHNGLATTNPADPADTTMGGRHRVKGKFILLKLGDDYYRHSRNVIELKTQLDRDDILAVSYIRGEDTIGGNLFIESPEDTLLVLKLLKPSYVDTTSPCWNYELRNVYRLGGQEVRLESLRIYREETPNDLEYETDGPNRGEAFAKILGLDPNGDGIITWPEFDSRHGLLIFPYRFPFALDNLTVKDSVIYRYDPLPTNFIAKYYIVVRYSSAKESFYIGQTDIEEGSEKVYVNRDLWSRDIDYSINYQTGELSFKRSLPPNADIRVTFEYRPWFSTTQKSLLGTRAEWKFAENGKIGSSLFYRSEGMPQDKPELGAEPFRRMIGEADVTYSKQSQTISSLLDRLPLLRAEAPSSFSFASEAAVSLPDPNTRGIVYLDDFESSTLANDISINAINWSFGSVPVNRDTSYFNQIPLKWFNPTTRIRKDSIFGPDIGREGSQTVEYLRIIFTPDNTSSWAGIMTCPSQLGMDFRELENIEVILRCSNTLPGTIHISVGSSIDEDVPRRNRDGTIVGYNGQEDTEDRNRNGILDKVEGEDTGLDTVIGVDGYNVLGDDGNDDYDAETNPTGTENNGKLDYEDLDRNGFSRLNDYFEYKVAKSDIRFQPLNGAWRFLRIPLVGSEVDTTVGSPRWDDIRIVRIWFDGFTGADTIDIYSIAFVGSKWRNVLVKRDLFFYPTSDTVDTTEKATLSQISIKTDPNYIPPFEPKRDYTGRVEIEASLKLEYEMIKPGHLVSFDKYTYDREDYRDYKTLRMYVHNDLNDPLYFLRIGTDSLNYYEYRVRVSQGRKIAGRGNWYEFEIPLDTFPKLKQAKDTWTEYGKLGRFGVIGNPTLAEVRYQVMGIVNNTSFPISGAIWFNDVRLHSPRKETGYGFQTRIGFNLADFSNFSFAVNYSDPNFRRFSEGRGVKTGGFVTNLSYDARFNLDRLLPRTWNFSIPLSYRQTQSKTLPKFSNVYPDLRLSKDSAETQTSTGTQTSLSFDNIRKAKSNNRLLNYTLEALSYSWRRDYNYSDSPLDSNLYHSVSSNFRYEIAPELKISLFGDELNLLPQGIRTGWYTVRSISPRFTRPRPDTGWTYSRADTSYLGSLDFDANWTPIGDLSFEYGFTQDRDFVVQKQDSLPLVNIKIGQETRQEQNFGAGYGIEIGEVFSPRIDYNSEYHEERFRDVLTKNYKSERNLGNGSDIDFSVDFDLPEILIGAAKLRNESKDTSAVPGSPHWLLMQAEKLAEVVEPIDFGYSKSRNSDYLNIKNRPDWRYRFGLVDYFAYDTLQSPPGNRDYNDNINIGSGARVKDLSLRIRFDHSLTKTYYGASATRSQSTTWPDLSISLTGIERILRNWALSSNISLGYSRRFAWSGNLDPLTNSLLATGQSKTKAYNFSPLFSWQASWKRRISTNLSLNYSKSTSENPDIETKTNNSQRNGTFSLSYSFNAPQGIKLPGLRKVKFSSDLSLTWSLRLGENYSDLVDPRNQPAPVVSRRDQDISTSISASYRVSRSVESGLNTGYSLYKNIQRGTASRSVDLNFWVLFRF